MSRRYPVLGINCDEIVKALQISCVPLLRLVSEMDARIQQFYDATSNAWVQFSDPNASAHTSRFYRLVLH
jgi:hypothetical protein